MFLKISDQQHLKNLLSRLKFDATPLWGNMTAQQMIEHLIDQIQYSNRKKVPFCERSPEQAETMGNLYG
ncbi:hypothetical protein GS399_04275 [Pedobacter sp. HMF7647]|uniref:Uncharacterized protein n=1 Tax=Hufsiella arboris TaxID=2695275 RepID=A0A7K1Y6G9_9SPHI|nr:hypothetical protein [Hufsiella arboris]MXV50176.1 hypothetical protein [Hufsiella arboris]